MRLVFFIAFCLFVIVKSFRSGPIWLLSLLVFIYFVNPEVYIWGIEGFRIVYILNITLIACTFFYYKKICFFNDQYSVLIAFLLASFWLSAFMAQVDKELAFSYAILFFKLYIFWLILKNVLQHDIENIELFYLCCMLSITFLSLWGIDQYLRGNIRLEGFGGGQVTNSNQIASAFVWALPIAYYKLFSKKIYIKILSIMCSVIILAGIVCTESRQAFLAVILYAIYLFFTSRQKIKLLFIGLVFVFIAIPFVPKDYFDRMETIHSYDEDASATGRIDMWEIAIRVFHDYPLVGVGGRNFFLIAHRYANDEVRVRVTHNTFFQILSEEGLIGLVLFLSIIFVTILNLFRISRDYRHGHYSRHRVLAPHNAYYPLGIVRKSSPQTDNDRVYNISMTAQLSLIGVLICCVFQNKAEHEFLYWSSAVAAALTSLTERKSGVNEKTYEIGK